MSFFVQVPWGSTAPIVFTFEGSDGDLRDLSTDIVRFQIRSTRTVRENPVLTKVSTDPAEINIPDPTSGQIQVLLRVADWSLLQEGVVYAAGIGITEITGERLIPEPAGQLLVLPSAVSF